MDTTWRTTPVLGVRLALAILVSLLILALVGGGLMVGSRYLSTTDMGRVPGLIAFDAEGDIWVARDDGSQPRRLTETEATETSPAWSPDGQRLAYWQGSGGVGRMVIATSDGRVERSLETPDGVSLTSGAFPSWSPDGRTVSAHGTAAKSGGAVVLWDAETGAASVLDVAMEAGDAAWSPDGTTIAFQHTDDRGLESVYAARPDGGGVRRLTPDDRWATFWPGDRTVFTPDSSNLVYQMEADEGTDGDIMMMALEAPEVQKGSCKIAGPPCGTSWLVTGPTNDLAGNVSHDGATLAFIRHPGPSVRVSPGNDAVELFVVPMDGSTEPTLVADEVCLCQPSWSPDDTRLATWTPDWSELVIFTVDGSAPPVIVPTPGNLGPMSWAPIDR